MKPIDHKATAIMRAKVRELCYGDSSDGGPIYAQEIFQAGANAAREILKDSR